MGLKSLCFSPALQKSKPYIAVIITQFLNAGSNVISKVALNRGMNPFVLGVYKHAIATLVLAPFAFLFERKKPPKMTLSFVCKILMTGMVGPVIGQNLYFQGLKYTSPTYASAMLTLVPVLTFVMAAILRMEKVSPKDVHSQAKIMGTIICVGGALLLIFYKGPILHMLWIPHMHSKEKNQHTPTNIEDKDWIKGSLMLLATCLCSTTFYILQTKVVKRYDAQLSVTTLICLGGAIESTIVTFIFIRDISVWTLKWNINLVTVIYIGVFASGITYYLQGYAMRLKGTVFATAFSPLRLIIVVFMGSFILSETLHLGSVMGGGVIVVGLYAVLWGKSKDHEISREIETQLHEANNQDLQFGMENDWTPSQKQMDKREP